MNPVVLGTLIINYLLLMTGLFWHSSHTPNLRLRQENNVLKEK